MESTGGLVGAGTHRDRPCGNGSCGRALRLGSVGHVSRTGSGPKSSRRAISTESSTVQTCTCRGACTQPAPCARPAARSTDAPARHPQPDDRDQSDGRAQVRPEFGSHPADAGVVERLDTHPVEAVGGADELDQWCHRLVAPRLQVEPQLRPPREHLVEPGAQVIRALRCLRSRSSQRPTSEAAKPAGRRSPSCVSPWSL